MHEFYLIPLWKNGRGSEDPDIIAVDHFPCVVGRHPDCDRRIHSFLVSRRHCLFSLRGGRTWVTDLGSRNGTFLNGKPVHHARPLADGDRLDIADLPFLCLSRLPYESAAGEAGEFFTVAGS
jgi:predicted component of type VI protein secretion system